MDFVGAIKAGFKNYANFRGTATRPEYWYWALFTFLASVVATSIDVAVPMFSFANLFSLATLVPSVSVSVRRLRDAGFSWTWLLTIAPGFVMFIGGLVGIVVMVFSANLISDPALLNNQDFLQSQVFQDFVASDAVIGLALTAFFGFILFVIAGIAVTVLHIMPSKTYDQGNKRLKPATPVI